MAIQANLPFDDARDHASLAEAPTRQAASAALSNFIPSMGRVYREERNYDRGPGTHRNVSRLSPFIRRRLITEEDVLRAALDAHAKSTCEKFVQEVFWRGYFKGWLEHRRGMWADYRIGLEEDLAQLEIDADVREAYEDALAARTGVAPFDAWVDELQTTGYLHNHARMWFASIWIFTLRLPWRLGADFFLRNLLDGDPASNTLSWRWVAGLHTPGKHYVARASNIAKFTDGRFHDVKWLADDPAPLEGPENPAPATLPLADLPPGEGTPYAFIVTDEDCAPESLNLIEPPVAAAGLIGVDDLSPSGVSPSVRAFAVGAVEDALRRLEADGVVTQDVDAVADWVLAQNVKVAAAPYAPVGPTADALGRLKAKLTPQGVDLRLIRRDYDAAVWPHATKGFFGLKKKIPTILNELDFGAER